MAKFDVGDQVAMPRPRASRGVPIVVTVTGLGTCDDGPDCPLGPETFSFQDPGGLGEDWMHTSQFERVGD
jgi:hypothetical protein